MNRIIKNMSRNLLTNDYLNYPNENDLYAGDEDDDEDTLNNQTKMVTYMNNQPDKEDDIYDFSDTNQLTSITAYNGDPTAAYRYTDDEEEDINFDYEYGYDYERVIKERLLKANQDFVNDSEPPKRKSILVSFDNAVTAIDIPIDEQQKLHADTQVNFSTSNESSKNSNQNNTASNENTNENNVIRLPLNDTVQKIDPDAFANKIKEAVQKYDAQINGQLYSNDSGNNQESGVESHETNRNLSDSKNSSRNSSPNFNGSHLKGQTPSPPVRSSPDFLEPRKQSIDALNENFDDKYENSDWTESSQTKSDDNISKEVRKQDLVNENRAHEASSPTEPRQTKPKSGKKNQNRMISFSAASKLNAQSPSPISSLSSSPEPKANKHNMAITYAPNPALNSLIRQNTNSFKLQEPLSSDRTTTNTENTNTDTQVSNADANERNILVEKDGVFKLMTAEEHTAFEQQLRNERKQQQQQSSSLNSSSSSNLASSNFLPHPPARMRPKTSVDQSNNRNNSLKTRFQLIQNKNSQNINTENGNKTSKNNNKPNSLRLSHSADPGNKRAGSSKSSSFLGLNRRTPEYASEYKSPYHAAFKINKPTETPEEKQKRLKDEEERKQMNRMAFTAWLKIKEEQREQQLQNQTLKEKKPTKTNATSEEKITFENWLVRKREQLEHEKEYKKRIEQFNASEKPRSLTPEEKSKAYKEWLNKKLKEKSEAQKLEKMELKKWSAKRRRSRKHQRLSQALELAQAYGYNSSYRSPGPFTF